MRWHIAAAAALLGCAGCASAFERSFQEGDYENVIARFATDSTLHDDPDALFRVALAYATPEHGAYDPAHARQLLGALLRHHPGKRNHRQAVALYTSLASSERLAQDGARRQSELDSLRSQLSLLERRVSAQEAMHADIASTKVVLQDSLDTVMRRLRVREAQMRALQEELQALKQIDLAPVTSDSAGAM